MPRQEWESLVSFKTQRIGRLPWTFRGALEKALSAGRAKRRSLVNLYTKSVSSRLICLLYTYFEVEFTIATLVCRERYDPGSRCKGTKCPPRRVGSESTQKQPYLKHIKNRNNIKGVIYLLVRASELILRTKMERKQR